MLPTVVLGAGTDFVTFDIVCETDAEADGAQTATITATATGWNPDSAGVTVEDVPPSDGDGGGGCTPGTGGPSWLIVLAAAAAMMRRRLEADWISGVTCEWR